MHARRLRLVEESAPPPSGPALRIAVATQDMKGMNAHFGSARRFAIYDVSAESSAFVEAVGFDNVSAEEGRHDEVDDRITPKVKALEGVNLLFVRAIGGPAAARVVNARIHPVKIPDPLPIEEVIGKVQTLLKGSPPPWLRKVLIDAGAAPAKPAFDED